MKCLTLIMLVLAAPLTAQVAPPVPPAPRVDMRVDLDRQRELEARQRELMERQVERQRALEERQRELQERDLERQRDLQNQQVERQRELEERQRELQNEQMERQRELQNEQMERQRELEEQMRERMLERDETAPHLVPESLDGAFLNRRPPAPWVQGDPADSLYRVARESLNRGDYRRAAQLFNELTRRYPNSAYSYVSAYYEAFSRYRIGTTEELLAADRALRAIDDRYTPSPNNWRRDNTDVEGLRTRIRGALAMRGDNDAADDVQRKAQRAGSSCDQEDLMVRVEALNALSQMDAAAALPILRRVLERKDECLVELRRRAVFMLGRRADAEATSILISSAKYDPNANVRAEAISYLPRMPGDAGLTALEEILRTSDDDRIQRTAVRALMSSENPRARMSLRGLLERRDVSETLRMQVLEAYSKDRSTADDAAFLRSLYDKSDSERMKLAIIGALARMGGKDNQDWLVGLVRNTSESSQLRATALDRLSRSDLPISLISRLYDAADSRSMRERLISALGSRKEPEATDKLIEIAKSSTDIDMRRLAINYLSRRNDPRANKLLMELIEK